MKCFRKKVFMIVLLLSCMVVLTNCATSNDPEKIEKVANEPAKIEEAANEPEKTEEIANEPVEPVILTKEEIKLKETLIEIKKNDYAIDDNTDVNYIIGEMVKYIGSADSKLRDDLILQTFVHWMFKLEPEQIKGILEELLSDNKLKYKIGEVGTDSVFTRSFSVLTIDVILTYNLNGKYLTEDEMVNTYNELLDYIRKEKDYRGRVKVKGWAHAVAHSADALSSLAKYEQFKDEELKEMLDVIRSKVVISSHEYKEGEEGRLVVAVKDILKRQIVEDKSLEEWVESIINYEKTGNADEDSIINSNVKDFLVELYSVVKYMEEGKVMVPTIEEFLEKNK